MLVQPSRWAFWLANFAAGYSNYGPVSFLQANSMEMGILQALGTLPFFLFNLFFAFGWTERDDSRSRGVGLFRLYLPAHFYRASAALCISLRK
ncbi:hypothetical protein AT864_01356 [Anoxybacillus sp. P3H1B]|jgi:hypothetical protein|uniref:Uncharacterized protein n=1 Tax=Anoxybacteroides rupiense TaxID=311460 RepID=A0ABD5ITM8_9BACL|nr:MULTISPECIES: hypothetical protein [Anoxybacillus]KXG10765.1 hypothetical protein AT864_01356 [Anoxybacillus sp. P3H1B]MBB3905943.1 hypothetical protein [Anoxybacillus rupiensis]MBS2772198.1 hypothetical protein [Anoxybacillus rupiensis]MED5051665.1 hypothetical protein [Anoxybacillus rupiensis]QHC03873.1 hypothetical protein GRQ40_07730 [Anoxybacillus sp. PDR2]